jgi:hypothetical protein
VLSLPRTRRSPSRDRRPSRLEARKLQPLRLPLPKFRRLGPRRNPLRLRRHLQRPHHRVPRHPLRHVRVERHLARQALCLRPTLERPQSPPHLRLHLRLLRSPWLPRPFRDRAPQPLPRLVARSPVCQAGPRDPRRVPVLRQLRVLRLLELLWRKARCPLNRDLALALLQLPQFRVRRPPLLQRRRQGSSDASEKCSRRRRPLRRLRRLLLYRAAPCRLPLRPGLRVPCHQARLQVPKRQAPLVRRHLQHRRRSAPNLWPSFPSVTMIHRRLRFGPRRYPKKNH